MATHSSIRAWRIPWTKEPGGLQYIGSQRVRHDWATNTFTNIHIYICIYVYVYFAFHKNNKSVVLVWWFLSTACHIVPITISPFYWNWTQLCFQNRARDPIAANRPSTGVQKSGDFKLSFHCNSVVNHTFKSFRFLFLSI